MTFETVKWKDKGRENIAWKEKILNKSTVLANVAKTVLFSD